MCRMMADVVIPVAVCGSDLENDEALGESRKGERVCASGGAFLRLKAGQMKFISIMLVSRHGV